MSRGPEMSFDLPKDVLARTEGLLAYPPAVMLVD